MTRSEERIPDNEEFKLIRQFCVDGLAASVPEFMSKDKAADIVCYWFPGDTFALECLYRSLSGRR